MQNMNIAIILKDLGMSVRFAIHERKTIIYLVQHKVSLHCVKPHIQFYGALI